MCGIAGFSVKKLDHFHLSRTLNLMKNRGPDFSKIYSKKNTFPMKSKCQFATPLD